MSLHLTYTGVNAGTYLCLRYRQQLGAGSTGRRLAADTAAHFAYAASQLLTADTTCPDCRHVATCPMPEACTCCAALGYQTVTPAPSLPSLPMPRGHVDDPCPDCRAVTGETCHVDCSSNWK